MNISDEIKTLAVVYFYNTIVGFAEKIAVNFGVPTDLVMLAIGYYYRNTWWGKGILYGAVASLGSTGALALPIFQSKQTAQIPGVIE